MDVSSTQPLNGLLQQAQSAGASTAISSDFETFLKMLTAQMENQDPLNPLDSQDFATQLATFSGVEQQVKTNDLLEAMAGFIATSGLADMADWIGKEARISGPAPFDGAPIEVLPNPPSFADSASLVIRDQSGAIVRQLPIPVSDDPIIWDGVDNAGEVLPSGTYSFSVEAMSDGEVIQVDTPDLYTEVLEIRNVGGQTMIVLNGGELYPSSAVTGLR